MKKIVLVIICLMLTGCTVHKTVVQSNNSYTSQQISLRIVLLDNVSTNVEQAADEYKKTNPNVTFEFVRYPNDESYRTKLVSDIRNGKVSAFSVRGEKDVNFFKQDIAEFDMKDSNDGVVSMNGTNVFKINQYSSCLWYNKDMLSAMQIDPHELTTISGLEAAVAKISELGPNLGAQSAVCSGYDLSSLICTVGFEKGKVDPSLEGLFSLIGQGEFTDPNKMIYDRKSVLYLGSERLLNSQLEASNIDILDHVSIPYAGQGCNVNESDYVCISSDATESQKAALKDFLKMLSDVAAIKSSKNQNARESKLGLTPSGWEKYLNEYLEKLRKKQISWDEFQNSLNVGFGKYSTFDIGL